MKEVALITIHGMGEFKKKYFEDLENKLKNNLNDEWNKISFQNVQYAPLLQAPQNELWRDMRDSKNNNDLDFTKLRKLFLFGFGDAASLEHSAHRDAIKYIEVQKEIQRALGSAYIELGEDNTKPVVIIAQSLGSQIISNYLWDAHEDNNKYIFENTVGIEANKLKFMRLKSLHNLITTGCNIPLFISGLEKKNRKCFKRPNAKFKWDNYYDQDDILGWPLKQLGASFNIVNDCDINAGGIFTSWNPFSHGEYWSDNDVVRPLTNILLNHLQ